MFHQRPAALHQTRFVGAQTTSSPEFVELARLVVVSILHETEAVGVAVNETGAVGRIVGTVILAVAFERGACNEKECAL